tara:strand:+ start:415 stop:828 length:414 start_codon:yes stop_codon:yes gene_type:complete
MILGLLLPNIANAQTTPRNVIPWPGTPQTQQKPPVHEWAPGQILQTTFLCKDEETIEKVVLADVVSRQNTIIALKSLVGFGVCLILPQPAPFLVKELVSEYVDHDKIDSVVIKVELDTGAGIIEGYTVVAGKMKPAI